MAFSASVRRSVVITQRCNYVARRNAANSTRVVDNVSCCSRGPEARRGGESLAVIFINVSAANHRDAVSPRIIERKTKVDYCYYRRAIIAKTQWSSNDFYVVLLTAARTFNDNNPTVRSCTTIYQRANGRGGE